MISKTNRIPSWLLLLSVILRIPSFCLFSTRKDKCWESPILFPSPSSSSDTSSWLLDQERELSQRDKNTLETRKREVANHMTSRLLILFGIQTPSSIILSFPSSLIFQSRVYLILELVRESQSVFSRRRREEKMRMTTVSRLEKVASWDEKLRVVLKLLVSFFSFHPKISFFWFSRKLLKTGYEGIFVNEPGSIREIQRLLKKWVQYIHFKDQKSRRNYNWFLFSFILWKKENIFSIYLIVSWDRATLILLLFLKDVSQEESSLSRLHPLLGTRFLISSCSRQSFFAFLWKKRKRAVYSMTKTTRLEWTL